MIMRIASFNVNGLRSIAGKGFHRWLARCDADVVAVQETRARKEQLPSDLLAPDGYPHAHFAAAERGGYSGVAIYSKRPIDAVETSLGVRTFDVEGRVLIAKIGSLVLANVYFPNGSGTDRSNDRVPFKLRFYRRLHKRLEVERTAGAPIVVVGDFNTAPYDIDLARPKDNKKTSGFLPDQRKELIRWLKGGYHDAFRELNEGPDQYTWWSQRYGVRERNVGWRIDLALLSASARKYLLACRHETDVLGSDHCPVVVELDDAVLGLCSR
jgi:exodeoxyribonuclease-3